MLSNTKSFYLEDQENVSIESHKVSFHKRLLLVVLSFLIVGMGIIAIPLTQSNNTSSSVSAWSMGIACDAVKGAGPDSPQDWQDITGSNGNSVSRPLSVFEAYGSSLNWTSYTGESGPSFFFAGAYGMDKDADGWDIKNSRMGEGFSAMGLTLPDDKTQQLEDLGPGFLMCSFNEVMGLVANGMLSISKLNAWFGGFVASTVFNPNLICEKPSDTKCVNLVKVIGGTSDTDTGGIINSLTRGIYLPLVVLTFIVVGLWILWVGIAKRKYREALGSAAWAVLAFLIGLAFLQKPAMLSQAPISFANTINGCILDAISGGNCVTATGEGGIDNDIATDDPCYNGADTISNRNLRTQLNVDSMSCAVWKAFVLEPWSQGQFGMPYESLNLSQTNGTYSNPTLITSIQDASLTSDMFKTRLKPDGSLNPLKMSSSGKYTDNIGAYQLYLMTMATDGITDYSSGAGVRHELQDGTDARWYKIVDLALYNDGIWDSWTGSGGTIMHRISVAFVSIIASFIGMILIVFLSLVALLYLIASIFLMAFAPIFFLIGIHPGRGKDILKGYFEMIFSNILKFLASELFLIVALALYGAVLGNADSMWISLIFVIVLSMALFMYRKEFVELLGKVDMGGKQMSNKMGDWLSKKTNRAKEFGKVTAGAAIGGAIATGSAAGSWQGFKDGVSRDLKRGQGFVAGAMRSGEMVKNKQTKALSASVGSLETKKSEQSTAYQSKAAEHQKVEGNLGDVTKNIQDIRLTLEGLDDNLTGDDRDTARQLENSSAEIMISEGGEGSDYAEFVLEDQRANDALRRSNSLTKGSLEQIEAQQQYEDFRKSANSIFDKLSIDELDAGHRRMQELVYADANEDLITDGVNDYFDTKKQKEEALTLGIYERNEVQKEYDVSLEDLRSSEREIDATSATLSYQKKKLHRAEKGSVKEFTEKQKQKAAEKARSDFDKRQDAIDKASEKAKTLEERNKEKLKSKISQSLAKEEKRKLDEEQSKQGDLEQYEKVMEAKAERLRAEGKDENFIRNDRRQSDNRRQKILEEKEKESSKVALQEKMAAKRKEKLEKEEARRTAIDEKLQEREDKHVTSRTEKIEKIQSDTKSKLDSLEESISEQQKRYEEIMDGKAERLRSERKDEDYIREDRRRSDARHETIIAEQRRTREAEIRDEEQKKFQKIAEDDAKHQSEQYSKQYAEQTKRARFDREQQEKLDRENGSSKEQRKLIDEAQKANDAYKKFEQEQNDRRAERKNDD